MLLSPKSMWFQTHIKLWNQTEEKRTLSPCIWVRKSKYVLHLNIWKPHEKSEFKVWREGISWPYCLYLSWSISLPNFKHDRKPARGKQLQNIALKESYGFIFMHACVWVLSMHVHFSCWVWDSHRLVVYRYVCGHIHMSFMEQETEDRNFEIKLIAPPLYFLLCFHEILYLSQWWALSNM